MAPDRPNVEVDVLEHVATTPDVLGVDDRYDYYGCPNPDCDARVPEWLDCPECYWYDEDVWRRTLDERSSQFEDEQATLFAASDGGNAGVTQSTGVEQEGSR